MMENVFSHPYWRTKNKNAEHKRTNEDAYGGEEKAKWCRGR